MLPLKLAADLCLSFLCYVYWHPKFKASMFLFSVRFRILFLLERVSETSRCEEQSTLVIDAIGST